MPVIHHTEMDIHDQHVGSSLINYEGSLKEKAKNLDTIIIKKKVNLNTIERIKEEDHQDSEIKVGSSGGDSDENSKKSDEKDKYGASRSLRK